MAGSTMQVRIEDPGDSAEVEVIALLVAEGDAVTTGTALMEVATDKANTEIESPADGVVESLPVSEGDIITVDTVLAVLRT